MVDSCQKNIDVLPTNGVVQAYILLLIIHTHLSSDVSRGTETRPPKRSTSGARLYRNGVTAVLVAVAYNQSIVLRSNIVRTRILVSPTTT